MTYIERVLIAIDQLAGAVLPGTMPDETMSAYAYRKALKGDGLMCDVIDALFFWQPNHCKTAYESEVTRKQLPMEYR